MKGSRDFGAQLFTALLRALGVETRLIFSLQPLGYSFGKQEDAHRLERRKDNLDKDVNDQPSLKQPTPSKKRKRQKAEDSDSEDLGLPKVRGKGISIWEVVNGKLLLPIPISGILFSGPRYIWRGNGFPSMQWY